MPGAPTQLLEDNRAVLDQRRKVGKCPGKREPTFDLAGRFESGYLLGHCRRQRGDEIAGIQVRQMQIDFHLHRVAGID